VSTQVVTVTRSLHPLPFENLDPRRFEDLIRQLAYDFRRWRALETYGRIPRQARPKPANSREFGAAEVRDATPRGAPGRSGGDSGTTIDQACRTPTVLTTP
jgi:hypothetical protein